MKKVLIGVLTILIIIALFFTFNQKESSAEESSKLVSNDGQAENVQEEIINKEISEQAEIKEEVKISAFDNCMSLGKLYLEYPKLCLYEGKLFTEGQEEPFDSSNLKKDYGERSMMPIIDSCASKGGKVEGPSYNSKCTLNEKLYLSNVGVIGFSYKEICDYLEGELYWEEEISKDSDPSGCIDKNGVTYSPAYS